ncbi:N-acetylmuramoyl-L-alanine amidase [Clostridium chromiireducens]|uniref:Germination-specific N-acetylmuramoyl-L-alanine amidase n=1 Tax=Clostridium chromiireducens TaxID=225345 RepID=A0A1V4ISE6_9CLOT|nr:N-acetylmuramoyl-L-alanine amidase [Clostridium chromiireducens]OPJ62942.1 germination-specific N-acetylmuramoyl-L-alanine amidase precursor [Clostridium chromiireducens]
MYIKKKLTTFIFSIVIVLSLFTTLGVQAATNDIRIVSDSQVTAKQAKEWAKSKGSTEQFVDLADLYFKYYSSHGGINPAIAYVQAAKETCYGKFGGVLDESFHNPCGLKIATGGSDTDKSAHKKFNSWDEGVKAHLDHLALYAGVSGYPTSNSYDERQFITIKGKAETVNSLGGNWAPSPTYGEEVNQLYNDLLSYSGIKSAIDATTQNSVANNSGKTSSSNTSNANPGVPEVKPSALNAIKAIEVNSADNNTVNIMSNIGWKNQNGEWYYYRSDNTKATGWIKPDNNWYYLKDNGSMATGWINDNGTWYYLNDSGAITKGWLRTNNDCYFLQGDGSMVTGLEVIDNRIYSFNNNGNMEKGWKSINGHSYYFSLDGSMATGWINDSGNKYYLYDAGARARGWVNLDSAWYYFKESGIMATGWITSGKDTYYLDISTGKMLTSTTIEGYKIGADGKRQTSFNQNDKDDPKSNGSTNNNSSDDKITITVDAGHDYGAHSDGGTVTTIDGITYSESDLDIQVAVKLKNELKKRGYNVVMTREKGEKPDYGSINNSLAHRVEVANKSNSSFFISIHHNAVDGIPTVKGVETYYSVKSKDTEYGGGIDYERLEKSKEMAKAINDSIAEKIDTNNRGAKSDESSAVGTLFVLRNTNMPAVLVETGFITNEEEAIRCASSDEQQKVAEAIAEAIEDNLS